MSINIELLMSNMEKDIKLNVCDKKQLQNLTESFILSHLEDFKSVKINNIYKHLNKILLNICKEIAQKFNIDESEINKIIEKDLFNINLRVEKNESEDDESEDDESEHYESENDESEHYESEHDESEHDESEHNETTKKIQEDKKCSNKDKKDKKSEKFSATCIHFMENKNEACGRDSKPGTNYCGYHKKYAK